MATQISKPIILDCNKDLLPSYTVTVQYTGLKKAKVRLFLAGIILKFAIKITGMSIKFEKSAFYSSDIDGGGDDSDT